MTEGATGLTTEQLADAGAEQPAAAAPSGDGGGHTRLLEDTGRFRERWNEIQTTFVDEPRQAVERADSLVADVIQELARVFADERRRLESTWAGGGQVNTEDLRLTLQRYREFFHVLLRD